MVCNYLSLAGDESPTAESAPQESTPEESAPQESAPEDSQEGTLQQEAEEAVENLLVMDRYTLILITLFIFQICFCCCIYFWTKSQVNSAQQETIRQQADYYQFLFNFHKQMVQEEELIAKAASTAR